MVFNNRNDIPAFLHEEGLTGYGAEIGVLRGGFSEQLLKNWMGKKLYLIDAWRHFEDVVDLNNKSKEFQEFNILETFNMIYPYKDRACLIRELSVDAARILPNDYLDFVYIDACHMYNDVIADLYAWYPKIKANGYLMGHDYLDGTIIEDGLYPTCFEVKSAVNSFALMNNVTVSIIPDKFYPSWYIKKEI
jgi:hypothetical protein